MMADPSWNTLAQRKAGTSDIRDPTGKNIHNLILQHPIACVDLTFSYHFSIYVQLLFVFTPLLFIAKIHMFQLIGHFQVNKLVLIKRAFQGDCYCRCCFFKSVMCCSHAHVRFYGFVA
jgi:hypothetical protein